MGWTTLAVVAQLVIIEGPDDGVFVYDGTPAAGNLIASVASAQGTDAFGNAYLTGLTSYALIGSTYRACNSNGGILNFLHAATEAGPWIFDGTISAAGAGLLVDTAWTAQTTLLVGATFALTAAAAEVQGDIAYGGTTAAAMATAGADASGYPTVTDGAGLALQVSGGHLAAAGKNAVTGTGFANLTSDTIPAGDAEIGATYKITAFGFGVWGSTQQQLNLTARFGASPGSGADAVGITPGIAAAALAAGAGFQWKAEVIAVCVTTGTSATWRLSIAGSLQQTGNALLPGTAADNTVPFSAGTGNTDITQDSTAAIVIGISAKWGSTTGAPAITKTAGYFERIA